MSELFPMLPLGGCKAQKSLVSETYATTWSAVGICSLTLRRAVLYPCGPEVGAAHDATSVSTTPCESWRVGLTARCCAPSLLMIVCSLRYIASCCGNRFARRLSWIADWRNLCCASGARADTLSATCWILKDALSLLQTCKARNDCCLSRWTVGRHRSCCCTAYQSFSAYYR